MKRFVLAGISGAVLAVVVPLTVMAGPAAARAPRAHVAGTTTITVTAVEFKFTLSKTSVKHGTVTFKVVNKGKLAHDFKINGKKTPLIQPGKTGTLKVTFAKAGTYPYLCTVPGHAAAGMKGKLKVT
ncbi:MAG: cupredoxin domain-containing protein [Solirubrobacteraceae bacterium]